MRTIIFFSLAFLFASSGLSQQAPMSIPCSEAWFQTLDPSDYDNQCILHIHDSQVSGTTPSEPTVIAATNQINVVNSEFLPGTDGVDLLVTSSRNTLELAWYEPQNTFIVPEYGKLELGVKLPTDVQTVVDAFIANGTGGFNPFNPEEVDVVAVFEKETSPTSWEFMKRVYGFYYEDFEMNYNLPGYTGTSEADWDWVKQTNEHSFRVRYAPPEAGRYRCKIVLTTPLDTYESIHIEFDVEPSNDPGYIRVAGNNKYLEYPNGELFFPMSVNFNATGRFLDKTLNYMPYAPDAWSHRTLARKGFDDLHDQVADWAASGGDMVRTISMPWAFEIEYESVNNYSGRMLHAWELDRYIEHLDALDLKLEWNMMAHYALEEDGPYTYCNWDWYDDYLMAPCEPNGLCPCHTPIMVDDGQGGSIVLEIDDVAQVEPWSLTNNGFCYHTDLGLEDPIEFFTSPEAIEMYKYKLRYLLSRYGYSTTIAIIELLSEINHTGAYYDMGAGKRLLPWKQTDEYKEAVFLWQLEMGQYIKEVLDHTEHLLAPSYLSDGINSGYDESRPLEIADGTYLFNPYIDVYCESHYKAVVDDNNAAAERLRLDNLHKPVIFSEIGLEIKELIHSGNLDYCWKDVGNTRTMLAYPFTGIANASNNWDDQFNSLNSNWDYIQSTKEFFWGLNLNEDDWNSFGDTSDDLNLSMSYIRTGLHQENNLRIFGVIFNHRYNEYVMADCSQPNGWDPNATYDCGCEDLGDESNLSIFHRNPINVSEQNTDYTWIPANSPGLNIPNMGYSPPSGKKYYLRFYNPLSGDHFFAGGHIEVTSDNLLFENDEFVDGQVKMEFPPLNNSTPFIFFELWDDDLSGPRGMVNSNHSAHLSSNEVFDRDSTLVKKSNRFNFYPNPVRQTGILRQRTSEELFKNIRIYNSAGQLVHEISTSIHNIPLEFGNLPNGLYALQVLYSDKIETIQIIKQ